MPGGPFTAVPCIENIEGAFVYELAWTTQVKSECQLSARKLKLKIQGCKIHGCNLATGHSYGSGRHIMNDIGIPLEEMITQL